MNKKELHDMVAAALAEDIGDGDITSRLTIPVATKAEGAIIAREAMIVCGTQMVEEVYRQLSAMMFVDPKVKEGTHVGAGTVVATVRGEARILLAGERSALNLMQRMCSVATFTRKYVDAIKGTNAIILDTRKTMPGLRAADKYAVKVGGGQNHRMRLDDMVLIKDNHIAICGSIAGAIQKAREGLASPLRKRHDLKVVVECDTMEQVGEAMKAKADRILLDNMSAAELKAAVKLVNGKIPLEASGGISLQNVRAIAEAGVDYISIGRITHSAPSVDLALDIDFKSVKK